MAKKNNAAEKSLPGEDIEQLRCDNEELRQKVAKLELSLKDTSGTAQFWAEQNKSTERLLEEKSDLIRRLHTEILELSDALHVSGRMCMHEQNQGVVTRVIDDDVIVTFETAEGPLEQIYHRSQFLNDLPPEEGSRIEAHVLIWAKPHTPTGIDRFATPKDIEDAARASEQGTSGPIDI